MFVRHALPTIIKYVYKAIKFKSNHLYQTGYLSPKKYNVGECKIVLTEDFGFSKASCPALKETIMLNASWNLHNNPTPTPYNSQLAS